MTHKKTLKYEVRNYSHSNWILGMSEYKINGLTQWGGPSSVQSLGLSAWSVLLPMCHLSPRKGQRCRGALGIWVDAPVVPPLWSDAWDAEEGDHDEGDAARRAPSLREGNELCIYQPKAISHPQLMEQRNINMSRATEQVREERCPRHPRCGAHSTSTEFLPWEKSLEYHTPSSQLCQPIPSALAAVKAGWHSLPIQIVPSQPVGGQNEKIWCLWLTRKEANIFSPSVASGAFRPMAQNSI